MINKSLWNDYSRLSPQRRMYSSDSSTFKKSPRDLKKVKEAELEDEFSTNLKNLLR